MSRKLSSFGRVEGLAIGAFGEVSQDVRKLLRDASKGGAELHWREMGAKGESFAATAIYQLWKQRLCIANIREMHRLKLKRLADHVTGELNGARGLGEGLRNEQFYRHRRQSYEESVGYVGRPDACYTSAFRRG